MPAAAAAATAAAAARPARALAPKAAPSVLVLLRAGLMNILKDMRFLAAQRNFWVGLALCGLWKFLRASKQPRLPPRAQKPAPTERGPLRQDGWGYEDTGFEVTQSGHVRLSGERYLFSGQVFPKFLSWAQSNAHIDITDESPPNKTIDYPPPTTNEPFVTVVKVHKITFSLEQKDRVFHCHGHTVQEVYKARYGRFHRIPDAVVFPRSEEEVLKIVQTADSRRVKDQGGVCLIPYGGGTSVSGALGCPSTEDERMMVVVSMKHMNKVLSVDKTCMTAVVQAGMLGTDMDSTLAASDVCVGHEPDSCEFSSVGGWVATKASGMKKNMYGNIEDIVLSCKMVTPKGIVSRGCTQVPRISAGLDPTHLALGSEGNLGIITSAVLRLRPLPSAREYGAIVFRNFEDGIRFMNKVAFLRTAPASIRLIDNRQFMFSEALKTESDIASNSWLDNFKKWYLMSMLKFDPSKMSAATIVCEGSAEQVSRELDTLYALADEFGGVKANRANGIRGYFLTYCIAYLRDFGLKYWFMAESFETSVPWDQVANVIKAVEDSIVDTAEENGVQGRPFVSSRVTQTYDTGACVYFYFGFRFKGLKKPLEVFGDMEDNARKRIMECGGSVSHHHGVGKIRKRFMKGSIGEQGIAAMRAVKKCLDPDNVFGVANTVHDMQFEGVHADGHYGDSSA